MPMDSRLLRIRDFVPHSRANGPGIRAVVWVQGCSLRCPGCFNPKTHPVDKGSEVPVDQIVERIVAADDNSLEGVTISGGEPLEQIPPVLDLLRQIRSRTDLSILLFTGYRWAEVQLLPDVDRLLGCLDVLLTGRFDPARRVAQDLRGSENKVVHFLTDRYTMRDLERVPVAEVIILPNGYVRSSGIDPVNLP
jgi:anaerobic ribonucleoside-triphosphate reductase activating protein